MKKAITKLLAGLMSTSVIVSSSMQVYAADAYETAHGMAGSTNVWCEVGYSGIKGYASITADDYVDGRFDGSVGYSDDTTRYLYGGFEQSSYGSVSASNSDAYGIKYASCNFAVYSDDGVYERYCYVD